MSNNAAERELRVVAVGRRNLTLAAPMTTAGVRLRSIRLLPAPSSTILIGRLGSYMVADDERACDPERNNVTAYAVFSGTNTGLGGPSAPTGKRTRTDYVYVMQFDGDKISRMT